MELFKVFQVEAAHWLPHVPEGHKCRRMHGHSFQIEVHVSGPVDPALGWVMDFADLKRAFEPLFERIGHRCLNDVPGLENSTCENLAVYVWNALKPKLRELRAVTIWETSDGSCTYRGDE